jgi:hypothetical protein
MIGKSGSGERGGSCTDVVHEIGKARTTVVCDRNNLHEASKVGNAYRNTVRYASGHGTSVSESAGR